MCRHVSLGLVLTGGGARAAYQVGALRAIADLVGTRGTRLFQVVSGVSAGAVNSAAIAARADDFPRAARDLWGMWSTLTPDLVYRTDLRSLSHIGTRWLRDVSLGGALGLGARGINHLLDTRPLHRLLQARLPIERIPACIADGTLHALAITATNYATGTSVTFFDGVPELVPWQRSTRIGVRQALTVEHVLASAAIPLFFPPVRVGGVWYGDGCVRMSAPLSPAIHLGAERVVAIGIRYQRTDLEVLALNRETRADEPTLSDLAGVLLNAVFLDALDGDLERVERINRTLALIPDGSAQQQPLRPVPVLALRPSEDLGHLAAQQYERLPSTLRYFLSGLGATGDRGWDLVSYLAFEPVYIRRLLDLGYRDTMARGDEMRAFLEDG